MNDPGMVQPVRLRCAHWINGVAVALHARTRRTPTHDGQALPDRCGYPMKLRVPTKRGYKNPQHIQAIFVTNDYPGGYWEDQGYNWFGGS